MATDLLCSVFCFVERKYFNFFSFFLLRICIRMSESVRVHVCVSECVELKGRQDFVL